MSRQDKYPDWFLWFWERFPAILMAGALIAMVLGGGFYFFDSRLTDIEERLTYAPPKSYTKPDLKSYPVDDIDVSQLPQRQLVYVPVYSHVYYQGGSAYSLETTLSIRNVDTQKPLFVESVKYYDTDGQLTKTYVDRPIKVKPLQTIEFLVEGRDSTGGSGANFLVSWGIGADTNRPVVEAVMVGTSGTQGISFVRPGIEISTTGESEP